MENQLKSEVSKCMIEGILAPLQKKKERKKEVVKLKQIRNMYVYSCIYSYIALDFNAHSLEACMSRIFKKFALNW